MRTQTGDARVFLAEKLFRDLERAINRFQSVYDFYHILVVVDDKYLGPPAKAKETRVLDLSSSKKVVHTTLVIIPPGYPIPPDFKQYSTALWEINNKIGRAKLIYILPEDKPMIDCEMEGGSEIVFNSGRGMTLRFNMN